jgi:hypothetical protein
MKEKKKRKMIASIERIPKNTRLFLNAFWIRHPKKRKECVEKYGFDPIEDEEMYWMHGLAEKEHRSILRNVIANDGVFSLKFAKMWAASELRSTLTSPSRSRSRSKSIRRRRSPRRKNRSLKTKSKLSGLRGGGEGREEYVDKGINPQTGGVIQYLMNLPVKIAATLDTSGRRIVNAFKNTSLRGGILPWAPAYNLRDTEERSLYGGGTEERLRFLLPFNFEYAKDLGPNKPVATPASMAKGAKGGHDYFADIWENLSAEDKNFIRMKLKKPYVFDVSIERTIKNNGAWNMTVFYLVEPLTALAEKYGLTLDDALRILHDPSIGRNYMPFIHEAFNST